MWMRIVGLAKERDASLYSQLVGFPQGLPNLAFLRPPQNSKIDGIEGSWFARRARGELPGEY